MVRVKIDETELGHEIRLVWGNHRLFAASGYFDEDNEAQGFYESREEALEALDHWFGDAFRGDVEMPEGSTAEIGGGEDVAALKKELEWYKRQR